MKKPESNKALSAPLCLLNHDLQQGISPITHAGIASIGDSEAKMKTTTNIFSCIYSQHLEITLDSIDGDSGRAGSFEPQTDRMPVDLEVW